MDNIKVLFGRKIRELRKRNSLTQAQLAEKVNVDDKHISCIEAGKNFPSADLIYRFSNAFKLEIKDLFEFYHLQKPQDLKEEIKNLLNELNDEQIALTYKYIRTFLLK